MGYWVKNIKTGRRLTRLRGCGENIPDLHFFPFSAATGGACALFGQREYL